MSGPIALISSDEIPIEEFKSLIKQMDGVVTHTTPSFAFRISHGYNHLWIFLADKDHQWLEQDLLEFVTEKLGSHPQAYVVIELSSADGSEQLLIEFAVQFAMRWNCVIYNCGTKVFKLQELLALKDIFQEFFWVV